jgi:hypothetical protein
LTTTRLTRSSLGARLAVALCAIALSLSWVPLPVGASTELLSLHVEGNRLIDSSGRSVVLHGVNRSGTEYMCAQDLGIFAGPVDQASVLAIRNWRANAVRVPLNEHCWLGVDDGVPTPQFVGEAYRQAIESYVDLLIANGLYVILDLHWSAPASQNAGGQRPMPDTSYSAEFWTSVANRFKSDGRVIFDLFNEPVPNNNQNNTTDEAARRSWECWRDGGAASCDATLSLGNPATPMSAGDTVGMQALVDAVRATGATNVIMLGGIQFANTLWSNATRNWLAYRPSDPLADLVAAVHIYPGNWCTDVSCYDTEIAPIAAQVPVVVGEFGIAGCDTATITWLTTLMSWLDQTGAGSLAWTWDTPHSGHDPCTVVKLLLDYDGTPTPYGQIVKSHLASLPVETTATLSSSRTPSNEGDAVTFTATIAAVFGSDIPTGSASFTVDGQSQTATLDAAGQASIAVSFPDDGLHEVVARYLGAAAFLSSPTVALTQRVENVPPNVGPIAGASEPASVGTLLTVGASFTDPGVADSHVATVDWGDGTTSPATMTEQGGSGTFTGAHAYAAAGIYRLIAAVMDDDGGTGQSVLESVVVFDPAAGSARGAGWFQSPTGAYASDQTATGRAMFGFLARYRNDATAPVTHPGFRLKTPRFVFESTSYEWLVITDAKAQLRGSGRIDGSGSYGFLISAIDGHAPGGLGSDRLRIKIWDSATGAVVYDSQSGAPDGADPVTVLAGGSIAVGSGR